MLQFGCHPAWTHVDAPIAGSSIIVNLPSEMIFKIFVSMAYAPSQSEKIQTVPVHNF